MSELIKDYMPLATGDLKMGAAPAVMPSKPAYRGVLFENLEDEFGNPILKKVSENTVVLGGAILALEHLGGIDANFKPSTLNTILGINKDVQYDGERPTVLLFGLGIGGSEIEFGSINAKDIKDRDIPNMVPLRVSTDPQLEGDDAGKYYMRKLGEDGVTYSWYCKEFNEALKISSHWKNAASDDEDGDEILADVYASQSTDEIETFMEIKIYLNIHDVREYFEHIGALDQARYNTLGIYTGNKIVLEDGTTDYVNVRLFAYTNFNNKDLTQKTESLYTYRIYSLV